MGKPDADVNFDKAYGDIGKPSVGDWEPEPKPEPVDVADWGWGGGW